MSCKVNLLTIAGCLCAARNSRNIFSIGPAAECNISAILENAVFVSFKYPITLVLSIHIDTCKGYSRSIVCRCTLTLTILYCNRLYLTFKCEGRSIVYLTAITCFNCSILRSCKETEVESLNIIIAAFVLLGNIYINGCFRSRYPYANLSRFCAHGGLSGSLGIIFSRFAQKHKRSCFRSIYCAALSELVAVCEAVPCNIFFTCVFNIVRDLALIFNTEYLIRCENKVFREHESEVYDLAGIHRILPFEVSCAAVPVIRIFRKLCIFLI